MILDIRTLFAVLAVMLTVSSTALWITWWLNRSVNGVLTLAIGQLILSVGIVLIMLRQIIDPVASVTFGNGLLVLGYVFLYDGSRQFQNRTPIHKGLIILVPLGAAVFSTYFHFIMESSAHRMLFMFSLLIALCFGIAREYLRATNHRTMAAILVGSLWVIHGLINFSQVLGLIWTPVREVMDPANYTAIMMMESIVLTVSFALGVIIMTTDRLQSDLRSQATMDPLTEIFNRRAFFSAAEPAILRSQRAKGQVSVLIMDLDHFKSINDNFGHVVGDAVLCRFARLAQRSLRGSDILGRFGGEEFIVLLPDTDAVLAEQVANRLREAFFATPIEEDGHHITATVSIGGTMSAAGDITLEELVRKADEALYKAKEEGRNRVVMFPS